jgi:hypothetical protein
MSTPNIVPNADNEGRIGKSGQQWSEVRGQTVYQNGNQVANLASPDLTGNPTAPTQASSDDSTKLATTAWIRTLITGVWLKLTGAPEAGNVLEYDGSGVMSDSGKSVTELLARTNHTGTQAASTILKSSEILGSGAVTLLSDEMNLIAGQIAANVSNIAGKAATSHTHTSANISDASVAATADVLVKRGDGGEIFGTTDGTTYDRAVSGISSADEGVGVYGQATGTNGTGGYFTASSTTAGTAAMHAVAVSGASVPAIRGTQSGSGGYLQFNDGTSNIFELTSALAVVWSDLAGGAYSKTLAPGTATADRTITLPNDTGTVVLGNGSGVTSQNDFRTALGIAEADIPEFAQVKVGASETNGYTFGSNVTLALEDAAQATIVYALPTGGTGTEKLVDGDGRGITSASAFRTAIGASALAGGETFTGSVGINPASGSTQLALTGALGYATSIISNPSAARTQYLPNVSGTLVATDDGTVTVADIIDAGTTGAVILGAITEANARTAIGITTVGDTLAVAANISAARNAIESAHDTEDIGYTQAYISSSATTTVSTADTYYDIVTASGGFSLGASSNFTADNAKAKLTYTGTDPRKFVIRVNMAVTCSITDKEIGVGVLSGSIVAASAITSHYNENAGDKHLISTEAIISLDQNDFFLIQIKNITDTTNLIVTQLSVTVIPLN